MITANKSPKISYRAVVREVESDPESVLGSGTRSLPSVLAIGRPNHNTRFQ